jgi:hypothetical protein
VDRPFEYAVYVDGEESRRIAKQALDGTAKVVTEWGSLWRWWKMHGPVPSYCPT